MAGWYGVDLDGTLAEYGGWKGPDHIGAPIPAMVTRVRAWLATGMEVRIFTARATVPEQIPPVEAWCERHLGVRLAVTATKDFGMIELWDDRCVQVRANTGVPLREVIHKHAGPTGQFPYGPLSADDEGELRVAIGSDRDTETVVLDFGKPTAWIGMRPEQAEGIAEQLLQHARRVRR